MNNYKKEVGFQTLIFGMVHKWKAICVCTILFVIVFGYSAASQTFNTQETVQEELSDENKEKIKSLEIEINGLQNSIGQQREYSEKSILMQIDPNHEQVSSVYYSIYAENSEELYPIYYMYSQYAATISSELVDAGKIDIDKKYLDEIVRISVGYDGSTRAKYGAIILSVIHYDMNQCKEITLMYEEALKEYASIVKKEIGDFELTKTFESYRDKPDSSIASVQIQNNTILGYDNISAANKRIEDYKKTINSLMPGAQEQDSAGGILRGIFKGIIAGIFVGIIIAALLTVFSDKIYYASDLQGVFGIDEVVCLEPSKKRKSSLFKLEKRLSGKYSNILVGDKLEKYVLYKANRAIAQNENQRKVAILGDDRFDAQAVNRITQCCNTIGDDLVQIVDNLFEFRYTENFNYYCGAIILVKEGATTYKQMCEIIKVLKEKEIRVIAIIAAIGEKG